MALAFMAGGLVLLAAWLGLAIVDPRHVGWLLNGNDQGQNSLGLIAYLRAAPPWPSLHDPLLMAPEGLSVAMTDSNPLLAILLRPFAGLLPNDWQYAGPWLLSCLVLQLWFAWRLVRPFAADIWAAVLAMILLAATPVLFARYGHINLCAQWLILWALWLFIDERRVRRPLGWMAVLGLAGLIHPYLLVMVAAIWASAQLRLLVIDRTDRLRTVAGIALGLGVIVAMPAMIGFLDEPLASTGTYGAFNMAIDALWNAGNGGYSALLPAASTSPAQGFEGMNYLGAGLLALAIMAVAARFAPGADLAPARGPSLRPLLWLLPAFAVLALIAIGPHLIVGGREFASIKLPPGIVDALDPLRASGRMFWPAYYTIALVIIASSCRDKAARALLVFALIVQLLDIGPMLAVTRSVSRMASTRPMFDRTPDARWNSLVAGASAIEVHPYEAYRDLAVLEQIAWRGVTACRPVPLRYFYASREPRSVRRRMAADAAALAAGQIDPTRLYVFLKSSPPPGVAAQQIDGIWIIAPTRPLPPAKTCS